MKLNLPILDLLAECKNILIAGAGGGFDIYAGLPIYFTLRDAGKTVHLANYSFSDFPLVKLVSECETLIEDLLMATYGDVKFDKLPYLPEPHLAQWLHDHYQERIPVWMFANTGAVPLKKAYQTLTQSLNIDGLILVDGGVDSIMRGNEAGSGTLVEDTLTLAAVRDLDIAVKVQACVGFGTEVEENVCHYNALQNMADLIRLGGFYGGCALTPQMPAFKLYESACRYAWDKPTSHKSHISTRIIPAAQGEFGNYHMYPDDQRVGVFISPLMALYWFFDAEVVIQQNTILSLIQDTLSKEMAFRRVHDALIKQTLRPRRSIPY